MLGGNHVQSNLLKWILIEPNVKLECVPKFCCLGQEEVWRRQQDIFYLTFQHNFWIKPYVPREPQRVPSNRMALWTWNTIYIRHCQESNSHPLPSQVHADSTRPQWWINEPEWDVLEQSSWSYLIPESSSYNIKVQIYRAWVQKLLTYGTETWARVRCRGRSRKTWKECVNDDMKVLGLQPEWAIFRDMWMDFIWANI